MGGRLPLAQVPAAWNARMQEYLGVTVPDDAHGVLQAINWSGGMIGYFPTDSLGNIISCQICEKANHALPGLEAQFSQGEFMPLREWLRTTLHQYGRKFTPPEMLQRLVGGPIEVGPVVKYLRNKLSDIYGLCEH